MSKRTEYLKEILRSLRSAHISGKNMGGARAEIVTKISKREKILESTVTNCYRRGIGFDGTIPFLRSVDSWINGLDTLERTITRSLKSSTDIQEMQTFFSSYKTPKTGSATTTETSVKSQVSEEMVDSIIKTLKDLHYGITRDRDGSILAKSLNKVDKSTRRAISVRGERTIFITISDKLITTIWGHAGRPFFRGEIRTEEELRLIDRLTRIK